MKTNFFLKNKMYTIDIEPVDTKHNDINDVKVVGIDDNDGAIDISMELSHLINLDYEIQGKQLDVDHFEPDTARSKEVYAYINYDGYFFLEDLIKDEITELEYSEDEISDFDDNADEFDKDEYKSEKDLSKVKFKVTLIKE